MFRSGDGLEPILSGLCSCTSRRWRCSNWAGTKRPSLLSSGDLFATPAPTSHACFWLRATVIWAASTRRARSGRKCFRVNPDYSLEYRRKVLPYKNPDDFELVVDGLRKAGLIE